MSLKEKIDKIMSRFDQELKELKLGLIVGTIQISINRDKR